MQIGFTGKAQNALNRAMYYACEMGHTCVGSEHLLLGLLSEKDGVAERVLEERGITFAKSKEIIEQNVGTGETTRLTAADITPVRKRSLRHPQEWRWNWGTDILEQNTCFVLCAMSRSVLV